MILGLSLYWDCCLCYQVGSSNKITLNGDVQSNVISAWKMDDDDSETIAEDDLLEADDLIKPDVTALKGVASAQFTRTTL